MYNKTILTGMVSAALFVSLSLIPQSQISSNPFASNSAQAAKSGCLPGVIKARLSQIRKKFGRIKIISAHRPGARIAGSGKRSYHASCRAVDFHPPKGQYRKVVSWLKKTHKGGVGTYSCGMHHIHLDNGPKVRFHHCVSSKGRPLRKGRKKRYYAKRKSKKANRRYAYKKHHKKPKYSLGKKQKYRVPKAYNPAPRSVFKKTYSIYY